MKLNTNDGKKIKQFKRILLLMVQQGEKPFDALAQIEKEFLKDPFKASTSPLSELESNLPFVPRIRVLQSQAPLTESDLDDQELDELLRFRNNFIKETEGLIRVGEDEAAKKAEEERLKKEKEEGGILNQLKKLIP